jgi:hypothetical protein
MTRHIIGIAALIGLMGCASQHEVKPPPAKNDENATAEPATKSQLGEIKQKKADFAAATQHDATCVSLSAAQCLEGLDKLLAIAPSAVFPTDHFDLIELDTENRTVDPGMGYVVVDFAQSAEAMQAFLAAQPPDLPVIKAKRRQFEAATAHSVICMSMAVGDCQEGLDKLLALSTSSVFPTTAFDLIEIGDEMRNTDPGMGYVVVDGKASQEAIEAFLKAQ